MTYEYISHPVDENGYVKWSETENKTWQTLVERQHKVIQNVACREYMEGLDYLGFGSKIPQIPELNKLLEKCNGWGVAPVPAIIQPKEFFELLANKRFPAATFIRIPEHLDYLQEPDIFHELYGHTPLLINKAYGDFMEEFGRISLKADPKLRRRLFRLFWFTIEFGLIKTGEGLKAYGGGILSSPSETQYCLTDKSEKVSFNALDALRTPYRIDIMQSLYFVIDSFEDLFNVLENDIISLTEKARDLGDYPPRYPSKEEKGTDQASLENKIQASEEEGEFRC